MKTVLAKLIKGGIFRNYYRNYIPPSD